MRLRNIISLIFSILSGYLVSQDCRSFEIYKYDEDSELMVIDSCTIQIYNGTKSRISEIGVASVSEINFIYDSLLAENEIDSIFVQGILRRSKEKYAVKKLDGLNYSEDFVFNFNKIEIFQCSDGSRVEKFSEVYDRQRTDFCLLVYYNSDYLETESLFYKGNSISIIDYYPKGRVQRNRSINLGGCVTRDEFYNTKGTIEYLSYCNGKRMYNFKRGTLGELNLSKTKCCR